MSSRVQTERAEPWPGWRWRLRTAPVAVRLSGPVGLALVGAWLLGGRLGPSWSRAGPVWIAGLICLAVGLWLSSFVLERTVLAPLRQTHRTAEQRANRRLLGRLVDSQEAERGALARELHDGPVQTLLASMRMLERPRSPGPEGDTATSRRVHAQLHDVVDDLRRISQGVRPVTLDTLGIERALGRHVEDVRVTSGLKIDYEFASPDGAARLAEPVELAIYRTAQEALSNVVRHAGATRASVVLVRTRDDVSLVVEDDGCGFSPAALVGDSIGLCHIRERTALVGGTCDIISARGRGTVVRVQVPETTATGGS